MLDSDKRSALERLKKGLYSRRFTEVVPPRHAVHGDAETVRESWEDEAPSSEPRAINAEKDPGVKPLTPERRYLYRIIFIASALFLLAAIGVALYTFFAGGNFVSVNNVDIQVEGDAAIAGGEPLNLSVSIANKNETTMQLVDLLVDFPQGTKDPANPTQDLAHERISIGDIAAGAIAQRQISALLFGQEGDVKDITFTAEYRTAGSNAIFAKEMTYHVTISSSPLLVSLDAPTTALSGQPFDIKATITSNTTATTKGVLLSLGYPFGFSVISSDPAATYGNNEWLIGDLPAGGKRVIDIQAKLDGQDGEERTIRADLGIQSDSNSRVIGTTIVSHEATLAIQRPALGLDLALDGVRNDLVASAGRSVRSEIIWTNNSPDKITNTTITAKLSGNVLDQSSVAVDNGGFYDSQTNTITWQAGRTQGLDSIAPGDSGTVSFSVSPLDPAANGASLTDPEISISASASGDRTDQAGSQGTVETEMSRSIKLASNMSLSARALHAQGPIADSGDVPPHVGMATQYTVVWTVTNTSNSITGVKVSATLPPYVTWTGVTSPANANLSYDPKTGTVTWVAGDIQPYAGFGSGAAEAAFQISLSPQANQVGTAPDLIGQATIAGTDAFTGTTLQGTFPPLSTRTTTDLYYQAGDETVQK